VVKNREILRVKNLRKVSNSKGGKKGEKTKAGGRGCGERLGEGARHFGNSFFGGRGGGRRGRGRRKYAWGNLREKSTLSSEKRPYWRQIKKSKPEGGGGGKL